MGGSGHDQDGQEGQGLGFGLSGRPAGAYVIADGTVRWRPAIDLDRALTALSAVAFVYLLTRRRTAGARAVD